MKKEIRDIAFEVIREKGVRGLSVNEVCHRAKISRVSFYKHFESKKALVNDVLKSVFQKWNSEVEEIFFGPLEFSEKISFLVNFKVFQTDEAGPVFSKELNHPLEIMEGVVREQKLLAMRQFDRFLTMEKRNKNINSKLPNDFILLIASQLAILIDHDDAKRIIESDSERSKLLLEVLLKSISC